MSISCPPNYYNKRFKDIVESEGYKVLGEYHNAHTKVMVECPSNHRYEVTPNKFKFGRRCPKCDGQCPIQAKERFVDLVMGSGYEILGDYINSQTPVKVKCNVGHIYNVRPSNFNNGFRCNKCAGLCSTQAKENFVRLLSIEGYELISRYKNSGTKVELKCPNEHKWSVRPNDFNRFNRCPHCIGSSGQRLLQDKLSYIHHEVIYNDREVLGGLELDIYYPKLNLEIEYQGDYWHSLPKHIERDKRKRLMCDERNINLIEVWDSDFMKNSERIVDGIINQINICEVL